MDFEIYYNNGPFSVILLNEDNTSRCAIRKSKNFKLFEKRLKKALKSEFDADNIIITFKDFSPKYLSGEIEVSYIGWDGEDVREMLTLEMASIY